ncbi:protein kinase family protein [Nocardiopsis xinjiangensis]|uniref:protein kinase family protein n=1 Tax=Nocardiopsis xinjiangensis TaxID=124285 RepID=UPI00034BD8B8|nr:protein kinase family protein [Nocardiopsis xinjiangensis]
MIPLSPHDPPRVGPYTLHARLGEDTAARTYLATAGNRAPVALKVTRSGLSSDPAFREAFTSLVQSSQGKQSPYVAGVLGSSKEEPAQWIAVSRPLGPTLAECVRAHGPLPTAALPPLALAMAQGLADLHAASRVHGSLGPDEILLTEPGTVLADAGFEQAAAAVGRRPAHTAHSAPEGGLSPAADVFAWAATLCFAASGTDGTGGAGNVPMQMRGLVDACLEEDTELRPTSADIVRILGGPAVPGAWPADLAGVIHHHGRAIRDHLAENGPGRNTRRRRRRIMLAASGLALALVAGGGAVRALGEGPGSGEEEPEPAAPGMISDSSCADADSLPGPGGRIDDLDATGVSFSPDGSALLATSYNHGLTVWDWEEGVEIARPADGAHLDYAGAFAPVGCMVAAMDPVEFRDSGYEYPVLNTHDLPSSETTEHLGPQSRRVLDELEAPRRAVAFDFAPSGEHLAVAVGFESGAEQGSRQPTVGIIDMDDGELVHEWGNEISVWDLAHVDDDRIIIATTDTLQLRDVETGELQTTIRDYTGSGFGVVPGKNEVIYPSNEDLVWWDLDEGIELDRFPVPEYAEAVSDNGYVTGVEVAPDLGLLHFSWADPQPDEPIVGADAIGTDRQFQNEGRMWDMETGEELAADEDLTPRPVDFHPDGEVIAAVGGEGDVVLLDAQTLERTAALP